MRSSGIPFREDEEAIRLAQAFVDRKCAVESPPEGLVGHGRVAGAWWGGPAMSYAILFEDGHEHGGYGEEWWTGAAPPPQPPAEDSVPILDAALAAQVPVEAPAASPASAPSVLRPRIVTIVPFEPDGDLGRLYNEYMRVLSSEDDWMCFLDHDAVHTTRLWHGILEKAILDFPDAGLFGAMTNRVGSEDQELPGVDRNNHDMIVHRKIGLECAEGRYEPTKAWPECVDMDHPGRNWLAGVLMLTSKRAWRMAKATDAVGREICGFQEGALFGVDNAYHRAQRAAGNKVYLLSRLYVYHWYRAKGDDGHVRELAGRRSWRP